MKNLRPKLLQREDYFMPQYGVPPLQPAVGMLATTTVGTTTFEALVAWVVEAEEMEEAAKPTTARAMTKVRMAMFFMCVFLLGGI